MNVQEVITRVQRLFGDEAAVQVQNADILRWINDAQIEIVKRNDSALPVIGYLDLVAGLSTYVLPTDLLILRSIRFQYFGDLSYTTLKYKSMQDFDATVDGWDGALYPSARPIYFTMYGGNAILFPTSEQTLSSGVKLLYNKRPTDVVGTNDNLGLPILYHNSILKYCMWQASLLDDDREPAVLYKADFQEDMSMLTLNENMDTVNTYPTITVRPEDM